MADDAEIVRPYAEAAPDYYRAGWVGALPVRGKWPPPSGWTGADGAWPSYADIAAWCDGPEGGQNIGLRLPRHVIGIDVDHYGGKPGLATLQAAEARWGALPPTWVSTSRDDGASGIGLFAVPEGLAWPGELKGGGVEIIQYRHRYVMAWPSMHPEGRRYEWRHTYGGQPFGIPGVDDLPNLPATWVKGLSLGDEHDVAKADLNLGQAGAWLTEHGDGPTCDVMSAAVARGYAELVAGGSRHEAMARATARVCHLIAEGHTGGLAAIGGLASAFKAATRDDPARAAGELSRLTSGAVRIAAAGKVDPLDPCGLVFGHVGASPLGVPAQVVLDGPHVEPDVPLVLVAAEHTSWYPVDLTAILAGRHDEAAPDVLRREDEVGLFYLGRVNGLIGPSESGKSWVALAACMQVLAAGHHVAFLDFEDTASGTVRRMSSLGVEPDVLAARFHYIGPDEAPAAAQMADLMAALAEHAPRLVVLDGFNAAMSLSGLDLMSNVDATRFYQGLLKPITADDRAIVYVDHTPKSKADESSGGIGAQAKRAMTSGCAIRVDKTDEFGPGVTGYLRLTVDKDRAGMVREASEGARDAGTAVISSEPGGPVRITITAPEPRAVVAARSVEMAERRSQSDHVKLMRACSDALAAVAPESVRFGVVRDVVGKNRDDVRDALDSLAAAGHAVLEVVGKTHLWRLVQPFNETFESYRPIDPASTQHRPGSMGKSGDVYRPIDPSPNVMGWVGVDTTDEGSGRPDGDALGRYNGNAQSEDQSDHVPDLRAAEYVLRDGSYVHRLTGEPRP